MPAYASSPYDENGFTSTFTITIWSPDKALMDILELTANEIQEIRFAELFPLLSGESE